MSFELYFFMSGFLFHFLWFHFLWCVSIVLLLMHTPTHTLMRAPEMTIRLPFNRQSRTHRALPTWETYALSVFFSSLSLSCEPGICWLSSALLLQHWHSCPLSQDEPWLHSWVYLTSFLCSPLAPCGRSINWHRFRTWRNCWRRLRILLDLSLCLWAALFSHSIAQWSSIRHGTEV